MGIVDGEVVVVTGAGDGIGKATALAFAREGAKVVVNDVGASAEGFGSSHDPADTVVDEIRNAGGDAVASYDDMAKLEVGASVVALALERFGRLDTWVNNAGIVRDESLLKMAPDAWTAVLSVIVNGTFGGIQAAATHMKQAGAGRIVNTTAVAGMFGNLGQANLAAATAAVYGLTRTASIELQRHGITVNAVAPIAKTRQTEKLPMFEHVESMTAEHVAAGHLFLGSRLCGDLTGNVLAIAGGKLSVLKVVESTGSFKDDDQGIWTATEIHEHWSAISKL